MTRDNESADNGLQADTEPKALLIFGAGGRLGRTLVQEALRRGHRVRAVVHRTNPLAPHPRLDIVHGDVRTPGSLGAHFAGIDVVLATLGSAGATRNASSSARSAKTFGQISTLHRQSHEREEGQSCDG